jgi:hypothetical protein
VPETPGILRTDRAAFVVQHVRYDQNLGIAFEPALLAHVLLEHSEAARECDLLGGRELLVAEENDFVVEKSFCDLGERVVVQGLRQIDTGNFGAEMLADLLYVDHGGAPVEARGAGMEFYIRREDARRYNRRMTRRTTNEAVRLTPLALRAQGARAHPGKETCLRVRTRRSMARRQPHPHA